MWSEQRLRELVAAGIISPEQERQIRAFEPAPANATLGERSTLLAYLGATFVLASFLLLVSRLGPHLNVAGRLGLTVALGGLALLVATQLRRYQGTALTRLASFAYFVALMSFLALVGQILQRFAPNFRGDALIVGVVVSLAGALTWRNRDRALLFLVTYVGLNVTAIGVLIVFTKHPASDLSGLVFLLIGVAAMVASVSGTRPENAVMAAGLYGATIGSTLLTHPLALGLVVGLVVGAAAVATGLRLQRIPVAGAGAVIFFIFVVRILAHYVAGPLAAFVALLGGIALVTYAVRHTRSSL